MLTDQLIIERTSEQPARSAPPPGVAADWTIPQRWERFTAEDHRVWDLLFARQQQLLQDRAVAPSTRAWTCFACPGPAFLSSTS
jgi:phenylalanine-4-hydroxylase